MQLFTKGGAVESLVKKTSIRAFRDYTPKPPVVETGVEKEFVVVVVSDESPQQNHPQQQKQQHPVRLTDKPKTFMAPPKDASMYTTEKMIEDTAVDASSLSAHTLERLKSTRTPDEIQADAHLERVLAVRHPLCSPRGFGYGPSSEMLLLINQRETEFRDLQRRCSSWTEQDAMEQLKECPRLCKKDDTSAVLVNSGSQTQQRALAPKPPPHKSQRKITQDKETGKVVIRMDSRVPIVGGYMFHEDELFPAEIFPISCPPAVMVKNTQRLRILPKEEFGFMMFPSFHVVIKGYNATNIYGVDKDFDKLHDAYLYTLCKMKAMSDNPATTERDKLLAEQHRKKLITQITVRRNAIVETIFRGWRRQGKICACSNASCFEHNSLRPELYVYNGKWFIDRGSYSSPCLYMQLPPATYTNPGSYSAKKSAARERTEKRKQNAAERLRVAMEKASAEHPAVPSLIADYNLPMADVDFLNVLAEQMGPTPPEEEVDHIKELLLETNPGSEMSVASSYYDGGDGHPAHPTGNREDEDLEMMMLLHSPYYSAFSSHLNTAEEGRADLSFNNEEGEEQFQHVDNHDFLAPCLENIHRSIHDLTGGEVFYNIV